MVESGESSLESPEAVTIVNHVKQSVYRAEGAVEVVANKNVDFRGSAGFFEPMTSEQAPTGIANTNTYVPSSVY